MKMMSLFDFLGKPAGQDLGKEVYQEAKNRREITKTRYVKTKNYQGLVMLYTEKFLADYFKQN